MKCEHTRVSPVPEVNKKGLLTGAVKVKCRDCGKVVYDDSTAKPTGSGNFVTRAPR